MGWTGDRQRERSKKTRRAQKVSFVKLRVVKPGALKRMLRNYVWYFSVWTAVGIFFFTQAVIQKFLSREPTPWQHYLVSWMV
ncbi:MAG: hypothetical protein JO356_19565, partial [Acidobacteria bacterium]|nr:hypothetical protein [Acidobacteriota bacterium]